MLGQVHDWPPVAPLGLRLTHRGAHLRPQVVPAVGPPALPRRVPGHQRRDAHGLSRAWRERRRPPCHGRWSGPRSTSRRSRLENVVHESGGRLALIGGGVRSGDALLPGGGRRRRGSLVITRRAGGYARRGGKGLQAVSRGSGAACIPHARCTLHSLLRNVTAAHGSEVVHTHVHVSLPCEFDCCLQINNPRAAMSDPHKVQVKLYKM